MTTILETPSVQNKVTIHPNIGKVNTKLIWSGYYQLESDRKILYFDLLIKSEVWGTPEHEFVKVYPRLIQHTDGKYYKYVGSHSAIPELKIKGDNIVIYKEILIEQGEKIEYYGFNS